MLDAGVVVTVVLSLLVGLAVLAFHFWRSKLLLREWVEQSGYHLRHYEYRWLLQGPFFWTPSGRQAVYRVVAADAQGRAGHAWVRCGSWWLGPCSHRVEVRWDD
jgi:hypothetical protein